MNVPSAGSSRPSSTVPSSTGALIITEVVLPGIVEPDGLQVRRRELPAPAANQVRVRVEATGISFAEQQMRRGKYYDQPAFPFVPGYDLVGTVDEVGAGVDPALRGTRVAAVTKTGGWASAVLLDAGVLVPVPPHIEPADAETVVVNGVTALQMLRKARVSAGSTILVHGANGGVGSTLVQLARHRGVRVIGTAALPHQDAVRELGGEPVDYTDPNLPARVRELAPRGVDAVFDHIGGDGIVRSWQLLAPGGTLVSFGSASTRDDVGNSRTPILHLLARLLVWNALPNNKHAYFYNIWSGLRRREQFQARLRADLTEVFGLLQQGVLRAQVAAVFPLEQVAAALTLAESRTVVGKVVLQPSWPDRTHRPSRSNA